MTCQCFSSERLHIFSNTELLVKNDCISATSAKLRYSICFLLMIQSLNWAPDHPSSGRPSTSFRKRGRPWSCVSATVATSKNTARPQPPSFLLYYTSQGVAATEMLLASHLASIFFTECSCFSLCDPSTDPCQTSEQTNHGQPFPFDETPCQPNHSYCFGFYFLIIVPDGDKVVLAPLSYCGLETETTALESKLKNNFFLKE